MSVFSKEALTTAMATKGIRACPMCGATSWAAFDQFMFVAVGPDSENITVPGPQATLVGIACENCGHLSMHFAAVLGLHT